MHPLAQPLGFIGPFANFAPHLLDLALKSTVLLVAVAVLALICRRASAATRHSIWFIAMVALLCLPLFTFLIPAWQRPLWKLSGKSTPGNELALVLEWSPKANAESLGKSPNALSPDGRAIAAIDSSQPDRTTTRLNGRWLGIALVVWFGGTLSIVAYFLLGRLRLQALRRRASSLPEAQSLFDSLCRELAIARHRPVTLLQSDQAVMPMTWGWWRPVVLLPAGADQWSADRQRIVLRHELAHVKRWDCLSQAIARLACAVYWFNPLVWLAARRLCVERERASDDLVLESGSCKPSEYASHLLDIARSFRHVPQMAAIGMARSSQLEHRINAIVDRSRRRRAPHAAFLSLLWIGMLGLAAAIAAQKADPARAEAESNALRQKQIARLKAFAAAKEKQSALLAANAKEEISPEYRIFFDAAMKGDGRTVTNMYDSFKRRHPQYENRNPDPGLSTAYWSPVLEISLAYWDVLAGEPKYIQLAVDEIINSIPAGSIYFGGTDPGRGLPTAFCKSHADADPFFTLTQNALADGSYLDYLRSTYGSKLHMLTTNESNRAYEEYVADARKRLEHDTKFPNEPHQIRPGEDIRIVDDKPKVSGQVGVMAINGLLTKMIFDQNPEREFYIEESFPLDWMYDYLEPHGLIMKINRQPLDSLSEAIVEKDRAFWQARVDAMLGPWLTPDTSVETVAAFTEKIYARRDLTGFAGDQRFVQNENSQKMFSKWRSAIAGVYSRRVSIPAPKTPDEQRRMIREADFAFRQAFALCPTSPEALYRYVNLLISQGRVADAIRLAEASRQISPNSQLDNLLKELQRVQEQWQRTQSEQKK